MKTTYWISTTFISIVLLWSAYTYIFSKPTIEGIKALGFPNFFRIQLAVLKLAAVAVLLLPYFPIQVKDWAYAGVALFFVTAIVAHFAHNDSIFINVLNLVFLAILVVSRIYLQKLAHG